MLDEMGHKAVRGYWSEATSNEKSGIIEVKEGRA